MDPSAGYRVPTRAVDAEIEIEGGRLEEVTFFLAAAAETHEGPETMGEALNRRRKFVPVRARGTGALLLLRRSAIVTVRVGEEEGPDPVPGVEGLTSFIDFVRLELHGGERLEGAVATRLPPENARMSDYFNLDDLDFAPLQVGEGGVVYVNKEFINLVYL
jgi:hypothetical protein